VNIGLTPEYIGSIVGIPFTNTFFTTVIVSVLLIALAVWFWLADAHEERFLSTEALRVLVYEFLKLTDTVTKNRALSKRILPLVVTFFLFIVTANLLALIPGFLGSFYVQTANGPIALLRSPNSDLTLTLALAVVSVIATQWFSVRILGVKKYIARFLDFKNPVAFVTGFFEMISEGVKILSFSFRLFGNVFAGEVLLLLAGFLVPYLIPIPFMVLEIFVGIIQAFIFAILTLTFVKSGTMKRSVSL